MTRLMFLSGTFAAQPIENVEQQPLLVDDLRGVAATFVQPGAVKDEFLKHQSWALAQQDDWEDLSFALTTFVLKDPASVCLFGFDMLPLIRRINGALASRALAAIPAYLWCGPSSRAYDIMKYLAADSITPPVELLRHVGVKCLPTYQPHRDLWEDQVYLLELATRFNLITEQVDITGLVGAPMPAAAEAPATTEEPKQKKRKEARILV